MSQPASDRNLLFGMLALQMDFIKRDQLIAAMQAWVFDKGKSLGEILAAQNALAPDMRELLDALVQKHLAKYDNNLEKSLAAISSAVSIKTDLEFIRDPDVQASLSHVRSANATDIDIYATVGPTEAQPTPGPKEEDKAEIVPDLAVTVVGTSSSGASGGSSATVGSGGDRLRFRILRPHARGGLGEVFVARDEELNRDVALKEIQNRQADNLDSRSRFMLEAEITGGLEHPGIVPVYGLGTYADGRPYYAMRFIRGDSLKEAIERFHKGDSAGMSAGERSLELRNLLGRFVDVCNAIAYAHSRGVLHRDLKPGNIMLGKYGETLVVDWGLAKPLGVPVAPEKSSGQAPLPGDGSLIPSSIKSASASIVGAAVGTPQFMSPEQAAGALDQIGPASDVYSLGATLFCVLTGQPSIIESDVGAILRRVLNGDLRRPREVKQDVPLPLEAICVKAMALKASDRYASPRLLADDIEHWLADEPVSAWPEPWTVKARRWIGRHRTMVTSAAAAVAVALVGLTIATLLLTAANERERKAKEFALEQKAIAEKNFQMARSAVDRYHTNVSENVLLNEPGMQPLRKKLLEDAREFYDKFVKERANDKGVQGELGKATFRLAQITGDLDSELDAIKLHQQALKHFETLTAADTTPDLQTDLASCFHHLGRLYRLTDQIDQSAESYKKALALWEQLAKDDPKETRFLAGLARTQLGLGNVDQLTRRLDDAQKVYLQALANWRMLANANPKVAEYRRDLAVTQNNLAMIYLATAGREADGEKALRLSLVTQQRLAEDAPNIGQYQNDLAKTNFNLGNYQEAAKLWQAMVDRHPALTDGHKTLAEAHAALAIVHRNQKELNNAVDASRRALSIQRKLAEEHPGVPSYRGDLARGLYALGEVLGADGQLAKAEVAYQESVAIQEKLPRVPHYQSELAKSFTGLGLVYHADKKGDQAVAAYKQSLSVWAALMKEHPGELEFSQGHAVTCVNLGNMSIVSNPREAIDWYGRAVKSIDTKNLQTLESRLVKNTLLTAHRLRADALTKEGRHGDSLEDWDRALELASPAQKLAVRLPRATALAHAGKYMEATKEASELLPNARSGDTLYRFACVYALAVPAAASDSKRPAEERQEMAEQLAVEAVRLLAKAGEKGFFKMPAGRERLKSDPDLQAVRVRPDFAKMASELKAN